MFNWQEELQLSHFKSKAKRIKLSEEDMSKADRGQKLGLLHQTVTQVVKAKEKFLKELKSAAPGKTPLIKKVRPYCW